MKTKVLITLAFFLVLLGWAIPAKAVPILDFNMDALHPATAKISYAGGALPLIGVDISVDTVIGIATPLNSGVILTLSPPPFHGTLSFMTGGLTGSTATTWDFGPGGSILVTGGIPVLGLANGTLLLSGVWTSATVISLTNTFKIAGGAFVDTKNSTLLTYYGLPGGAYSGTMNLQFEIPKPGVTPPAAFASSQVLSGDITNTPTPVAEASIILFMGAGLVGIWGFRKRFINR